MGKVAEGIKKWNYPQRLFILFILIFSTLINQAYSQDDSIKQLEDQLNDLYGIEKLKALNELTAFYLVENERKALRYARQAVSLGENIFNIQNTEIDHEKAPLVQAYFQLGRIFFEREKYFEAKQNLDTTLIISQQIGDNKFVDKTISYLKEIEAFEEAGEVKQSFLSKTIGTLKVGEAISQTTQNLSIQTEIRLAESSEKSRSFQRAIDHYEKAINLLRNTGDTKRIIAFQLKIAMLLDSLDQHVEAQRLLNNVIGEIEQEQTKATVQTSIKPIDTALQMIPARDHQETLRNEQQNLKDLSDSFAKKKDYEKSLAYLKKYQELSIKMKEDSIRALIEQKQSEDEIILLKQQKEIVDLKVNAIERENAKQVRLRKTLIFIVLIILIGTILTTYFYLSKRREHKKLAIAYSDLDKTKHKLEDAEQRIVKLLEQQVSGDVAKELLTRNTDKPGEKRFVSIMFLDIREFTPMAEKLSPEELIDYQNKVFGFMIDIIQKYNGNINQLLGDGFMATFGAPVSHGNDCQNSFMAAKEMLQELEKRNSAKLFRKTKIGIGLHAGFVVTGNVGNEARKQYSVTGNPVIIASRVEQLTKTYNANLIITEEVYNKLEPGTIENPSFIQVEIKGRSKPVKILKVS